MTSKCITSVLFFATIASLPKSIAADTQPVAGRYRIAYATFIGGSQWDQVW